MVGNHGTHRCLEGRVGRGGRPQDGVRPPEVRVSEKGSPGGDYWSGGISSAGGHVARIPCRSVSEVSGSEQQESGRPRVSDRPQDGGGCPRLGLNCRPRAAFKCQAGKIFPRGRSQVCPDATGTQKVLQCVEEG